MPTAIPRSFPKRKPWHRPAAGALVKYTEENKAVLLAVEPATKAEWDLVEEEAGSMSLISAKYLIMEE
jgi:hypothetical protein